MRCGARVRTPASRGREVPPGCNCWRDRREGQSDRPPAGEEFETPSCEASRRRFGDRYGDVHTEESSRWTFVGAPQGQHLLGRPCNRDANQIPVADDTVGGVEIDPAGAGQIGLHPGMCGSAACEAGTVGHEDIAADKPRRDTKRPGSFHHEDREIPATATPCAQRLLGSLHASLGAADVDELLANADRKSTRLNSSHLGISYAVFCLKKKR